MIKSIAVFSFAFLWLTSVCVAQNTNSSTTQPAPTTNTNRSIAPRPKPAPPQKAAPPSKPTPAPSPAKPPAPPRQPADPGSATVVTAFNQLLEGIRAANVDAVTNVYWKSPRLVLFNNNGTVTKGWDQMRKNRESSYPDLKDVKLDVRDVSVIMLGRDGAVVSCLWTQSQTYKETPETATGRMTLVFRRTPQGWQAVHLHTSPDKEDPSRVLPSEQATPTPSPTPPNQ